MESYRDLLGDEDSTLGKTGQCLVRVVVHHVEEGDRIGRRHVITDLTLVANRPPVHFTVPQEGILRLTTKGTQPARVLKIQYSVRYRIPVLISKRRKITHKFVRFLGGALSNLGLLLVLLLLFLVRIGTLDGSHQTALQLLGMEHHMLLVAIFRQRLEGTAIAAKVRHPVGDDLRSGGTASLGVLLPGNHIIFLSLPIVLKV